MPPKQVEKPILKTVYDELIKSHVVRTQNEFSTLIEFNQVATSQMLHGLKPINIRLLEKLYFKLNINTNYLISGGQGNIYRDPECMAQPGEIVSLKSSLKNCLEEKDKINKTLADKEKIIFLYEALTKKKVNL